EDVEAVEGEADGGMVGAAHHLPRIAVVADVAAPGQRLEADPDAALLRALAELVEIRRGAGDPAERVGGDVGTDHQQIAAKSAHRVEFALGARKGAAAWRFRHAFEIAERLEGYDLQSERGHDPGDVLRRAIEGQQVALEYLHASEAGSRDRFELLGKTAAQ